MDACLLNYLHDSWSRLTSSRATYCTLALHPFTRSYSTKSTGHSTMNTSSTLFKTGQTNFAVISVTEALTLFPKPSPTKY